jgi:hypothetical protein
VSSVEVTTSLGQAAKAVGVSEVAISRVRYAEKHGVPELVPAIESGKVTPFQAIDIAHFWCIWHWPKSEIPFSVFMPLVVYKKRTAHPFPVRGLHVTPKSLG